jgi:magnesium transporter
MARFEIPEGWIAQACRFALDATPAQEAAWSSHASARNFAYNIDQTTTQINTVMTIAAERLAVIAAVTLPITALSSVVGMNVIVNDRSDSVLLTILLVIMSTMSVVLLVWAKRRGWW